ncbi:MAG: hypothetical protein RIE59_20010 [Imperialibacter sp.]
MKRSSAFIDKLDLLLGSLAFIRNHFVVLLGLGLVAAFGRVIQLGGLGEIPTVANWVLEVMVEGARLLICLYVLGIANSRKGLSIVKRILTGRVSFKQHWPGIKQKFQAQWAGILISFTGYLAVAGVFNILIDQLAYETCLFLSLKGWGVLVDSSSEWTILLFFKNLSVIPLTLVFETFFLLWITDKLLPKKVSDSPAA